MFAFNAAGFAQSNYAWALGLQLDWQLYGTSRAEECDVPPERVVNTWSVEELLAWTSG